MARDICFASDVVRHINGVAYTGLEMYAPEDNYQAVCVILRANKIPYRKVTFPENVWSLTRIVIIVPEHMYDSATELLNYEK